MLLLHHSNRVEHLIERLGDRLESPLSDPFKTEIILVQSRGMQRWLDLKLSSRFGVWANAEYPFPNPFLNRMIQQTIGEALETSPFQRDALRWLILQRLPEYDKKGAFAAPLSYIERDDGSVDDRKLFQLASRIATVFDNYDVYRPEMLKEWETDPPKDDWQAQLWHDLVASWGSTYRGALRGRFLDALAAGKTDALPERLTIFGISSMPPFFLDCFMKMGRHIDVDVYILNPCQEYWGDIHDERYVLREEIKGLSREDGHFDLGHPLLATLGRNGREFLCLLQDLPSEDTREFLHYEEPGAETQLSRLQRDMLLLKAPAPSDTGSEASKDGSIRVHACHSTIREMQVLLDQVLDVLSANPDMEPRDILVMAPDIESYAPAVEAVFNNKLPYSVADRSARRTNPVASGLFDLLALLRGRFEASSVVAFLDHPALQARWDFDVNAMERIRDWVQALNINWGVDADHVASEGLPREEANTWRFGLRRALLGVLLPGDDRELHQGVLPFDDIEGNDAALLGRMADLLERLFTLREDVQTPRPVDRWAQLLIWNLDQFFQEDDDSARDWKTVRDALQQAADHAKQAGLTRNVPLGMMEEYLEVMLQDIRSSAPFLGAGITFCSLLPMRSIPFEMVCLVGMNEADFPRHPSPLSFDRMAADPKSGDRSPREEDRSMFLEALLSARRVFSCSFLGLGQRDNRDIPPSVVLSELMDLLAIKPVKHPLQAFNPAIFSTRQESQWFSYSEVDFAAAKAQQHGTKPREAWPLIPERARPENIRLDDLIRFYQNPTRWFLEQVMNISLPFREAPLQDLKTTELDPLPRFALRTQFLRDHLEERDSETSLNAAGARGQLPHGPAASPAIEACWTAMEDFSRSITDMSREPAVDLEIDLGLSGCRIVGILPDIHGKILFNQHPGSIRSRDRLSLWIRHLAANAQAGPVNSIGFGIEKNETKRFRLSHMTTEAALKELQTLCDLFELGQTHPLPFFPECSFAYAKRMNSKGNHRKDNASRDAKTAWARGFLPGEMEKDAWIRFAYGDKESPADIAEFDTHAEAVFTPLLQHLKEKKEARY